MSYHFSMGAINKFTNNYEYPKIANKINKYKCPFCENDVIFKKGTIFKPHFAHCKSVTPCYYYDRPSESEIHKDAKMLMKTLLDNKTKICIKRNCKYNIHANIYSHDCNVIDINYNENTNAVIEYKFKYNNSIRSADVALIDNNTINFIFEICYKNKTKEENRPEPWVEINAEDLINSINSGKTIDEKGNTIIECIRDYKCNECKFFEFEANEQRKINFLKLKQKKLEFKRLQLERYPVELEKIKRLREERERVEKERVEKERVELEKWNKKADALRQLCKCGIALTQICICEKPNYELVVISNNLFCKSCKKWKCRC